MRVVQRRAAALMSLLAACSFAAGDGRKEIVAVYDGRERAFAVKDYDALAGLLAPDYTREVGGEKLDREGAIAAMKKEMKRATPPLRVKIKVSKLAMEGDGATCHVTETFSYHVKGNDRRMHRLRYMRESEERLRRIEGKWLVSSSVGQAARYWIDEKAADAAAVHRTLGL